MRKLSKFKNIIKLCKPIKKDIWGINSGINIIHSKCIFLIFKISVNSTHMIVNKEDSSETTKEIKIEINITNLFCL